MLEEGRDELWTDFIKMGASESRSRAKHSRQQANMDRGPDMEMSMGCLKDNKELLLDRLGRSTWKQKK
jgi:hypothetical protein